MYHSAIKNEDKKEQEKENQESFLSQDYENQAQGFSQPPPRTTENSTNNNNTPGQSQIDLSMVPKDMMIFQSAEKFLEIFITNIKITNQNATDIDIQQNTRIQEIILEQKSTRLMTFLLVGGTILFWIVYAIIFGEMFRDFSQGFAKFLIITGFIAWLLTGLIVIYSSYNITAQYLKIAFLAVGGIILFEFIGFCIIAGKISGGYIFFMIFLCFGILPANGYGLFKLVQKIEYINSRWM
ncbi:hypothetical protein PPERSA_02628 [Pseudocohnilembus persalinus]|uniref:Uncharacterized protein n=1 Tax=Pseudocohnilembus persalinus TaxID=266149 RepID=A0A0V0R5K4_PSEPJ|nr:hypothetical protein PPERSA_02628 [Pseudocohnilembus persalinus]|eukprot:KRX09756.1 hypothetical protein PPERSA_02628 [Pseudocohnilembus persalinus]